MEENNYRRPVGRPRKLANKLGHRITFIITDTEGFQLRQLAELEKMPMSEYVRNIIVNHMVIRNSRIK